MGTHIQWTDETWNPVTGCTKVSAGCDNCYIERTPPFRMQHRKFDKPGVGGTTGVTMHPDRLDQPLHWRKPRRVFVNSLADLFHDAVTDLFIAQVFSIARLTPRHTYQVLTKRPARMKALLGSTYFQELVWSLGGVSTAQAPGLAHFRTWPTPNVWLGVSVETQQWADVRIPLLLDTLAAVRFLSCEPLLGPVDLHIPTPAEKSHPDIDWVIVGGESGPGARPMHPDWAESLQQQCEAASVPFFFKQWGEWTATKHYYKDVCTDSYADRLIDGWLSHDGHFAREVDTSLSPSWIGLYKVGKTAAGRRFLGRTWDEYPAVPVTAVVRGGS